jgi:hypothetical protein
MRWRGGTASNKEQAWNIRWLTYLGRSVYMLMMMMVLDDDGA